MPRATVPGRLHALAALAVLLLVTGILQSTVSPANAARGSLTPSPENATKDVPDLYAQGCHVRPDESRPRVCTYGSSSARYTIALVGDSKMAQWAPAFQALAKSRNWRIRTYTMSGCTFSAKTIPLRGEPYTNCRTWSRAVMARLIGTQKPDVVVNSSFRGTAYDTDGRVTQAAGVEGLATYWKKLGDNGVDVVVLGDNPHPTRNLPLYECVARNTGHLSRCFFRRSEAIRHSGMPTQIAAAEKLRAQDISPGKQPSSTAGKAYFMDLSRQICPTYQCSPVRKRILLYRQGSHLTATYARFMTPYFGWSLSKIGIR